jgi:hypothetical protein
MANRSYGKNKISKVHLMLKSFEIERGTKTQLLDCKKHCENRCTRFEENIQMANETKQKRKTTRRDDTTSVSREINL